MISMMKLFHFAAVLPLAFAGCTSTNPKSAFDDVGKHVAARTGQEVRWMRDDSERDAIEQTVATLLQTNLKDRKSTRLNSSHLRLSRMPSSA